MKTKYRLPSMEASRAATPVGGGKRKFQGFCRGWKKWEAQVYMEKTEQTEISPFAVQGVLAALKEVQDTVRAYDTSPVDPEAGTLFLPSDREAAVAQKPFGGQLHRMAVAEYGSEPHDDSDFDLRNSRSLVAPE